MNVSGVEIGAFNVVADNGQSGDYKVELCVGLRLDGRGKEPFLDTNGGPIMITVEESPATCSIEHAAEALRISAEDLRALVLSHAPDLDW